MPFPVSEYAWELKLTSLPHIPASWFKGVLFLREKRWEVTRGEGEGKEEKGR